MDSQELQGKEQSLQPVMVLHSLQQIIICACIKGGGRFLLSLTFYQTNTERSPRQKLKLVLNNIGSEYTPSIYRIAGNFRWCKFSYELSIVV